VEGVRLRRLSVVDSRDRQECPEPVGADEMMGWAGRASREWARWVR
jgi:hypothetical protein